ncbi:MAG: hypothetical protein R2698_14815 [Microthrixaceae bacterium]
MRAGVGIRGGKPGPSAGNRRRFGITLAAVVALLAGTACEPPDWVLGADRPLDCVPRIGTNQIVVPLPGLFLPLPSIKGLSEFDDLTPAPEGLELPSRVDLRDNRQGFNGYAEFVLAGGSLYTRPHNSGARWHKAPTPECLDGRIVAISVDSNMAVALDSAGWIYSLDNLLSGPMLWNWTRSFGGPIWLWPGMKVPADALGPGKWALSHRISSGFVDAKGYRHPMTAGLVQLVSLTGGGSRIVFQDPWLPADHSYEIGGPIGGRFGSEAVSASGSVTFVMNRFGDMYTRKYDLDLAGANHIPCRYTWQDQGDRPSAPNQWEERTDPTYAAISLPAEEWRHQPKIPGEITARISISQTGPAMEDRDLRVEGLRDGRSGYWHKGLAAPAWEFTPTDTVLQSPVLSEADPQRDQSGVELAPPSGLDFEGTLGDGWTARVEQFDWAQTRHAVELRAPSGRIHTVVMYTTDGLRLEARSPGLDERPRALEGALDVRAAMSAEPEDELGRFVRSRLGGHVVYEIRVDATVHGLVVSPADPLTDPLGTLRRT